MTNIMIDKENGMYIKDTNPFEKYSNIENDIISFYMKYNQLKNLYRQGWLKVRIGLEHKEKCESVADHSFSMALLGITIIEKHNLNYDILKVLKMCIVHELGEIYAGDPTPYDNITPEDKHNKEEVAIKKVISSLDFDNDFFSLWKEFEEGKTKEAKFVKELDSLEFLCQAAAYGLDVSCFHRSLSKINDKYLMEIVEQLKLLTSGNEKPKKIG